MIDKDFVVNIPCPEVSELLQNMAFKAGYTWADKKQILKHTNADALVFRSNKHILYNPTGEERRNTVSIEMAIQHFESLEEEFKPGDWVIAICGSAKYIGIFEQGIKLKIYKSLPDDKHQYYPNWEDGSPAAFDKVIRRATSEEIDSSYKIGDYVVATKDLFMDGGELSYRKGTAYPITYISEKDMTITDEQGSKNHYVGKYSSKNSWAQFFRPALQNEINLPLMVGNHEVHFRKESVKIGCLGKENRSWLKLQEVMENFDLKKVQHKDGTLATKEDIDKICRRIRS